MKEEVGSDELILAWVRLSGLLKNTRITKGLLYNEAIVMLLLYNRHREDGRGTVSMKEIVQRTGMLKSLVNRTVNSLTEKGLLERCTGEGDRRIQYVKCVEEKLPVFLEVHSASLALSDRIRSIIGEEDAAAFIRIVKKLDDNGFTL